ncbi:hypothetical protein NCER_100527 [Vairimorpha ceranae BRL01]|uniref:Uncharacterized protein n=2 Tax=Vairimorpha ceranae TaxID=40302 RepID=C4V7T6_VAIC1|nr:hypothetical protein AAJ76_7100012254 [Vairimorpha ceranae]EEQ82710.1 hypothetical protein NCER_100527 [Vairimorpha ceranae BRL01]KAF5139904.1 hypothetical protein G9O61_00g019230 [Vairimorpha ceranae]KKO74447.1 hypothetical protein AAJ76_7100012254 [Vairimorpha ceranae]
MWLYFTKIKAYSLDLLLNKKILIRSIPYVNFIIAEDISDFSLNVFHTKNLDHISTGYNKIALLEKDNNKYKIKIGNYYICQNKDEICNYNPPDKKCLDKNFNKIDCDVCRNKTIKACDKQVDLWDIELTSLGYIIKQNDQCLTIGFKLLLDECKESKSQLFGFEDYELMSCVENFNFKKDPQTRKEAIDLIKMNKLAQQLAKNNPKINKKLNDKKKEEAIDEVLKNLIPDIENKPKMKKLWKNLWNYDFKGWSLPKGFKLKMFCSKWW